MLALVVECMMNFTDHWIDGVCIPDDIEKMQFATFAFSKRGWVYIAKNTLSSTGSLKIGRTSKSPFERMNTLVTSGVEGSYTLMHAVAFVHSHWAEQAMHRHFNKECREKEFFGVHPTQAYDHLLALQRQEMVILSKWSRSFLLHAPNIQQFIQHYVTSTTP